MPERPERPEREPWVLVQVYCTVCGNRASRDLGTGDLVEGAFRLTPSMIAQVRAGKCLYCQGAMDVTEIPEPPNLPEEA